VENDFSKSKVQGGGQFKKYGANGKLWLFIQIKVFIWNLPNIN